MNGISSLLADLAYTVAILTGIGGAIVAFVRYRPLRWIKARTIDRFRAWVESPHDDVKTLLFELGRQGQQIRQLEATATHVSDLDGKVAGQSMTLSEVVATGKAVALELRQLGNRVDKIQQDVDTLRNWVENLVLTDDGDDRQSVKSMTDVMKRIDTVEGEFQALQDAIGEVLARHDAQQSNATLQDNA